MPQWDAEVIVDESQARDLIAAHFPHVDTSDLTLIGEGWDNTVWGTRDGIAFRFPRREIAVPGVEREIAILPMLAPRLPVAIPDAAYAARPSEAFGWPWFGSRMIDGQELASTSLGDSARIALGRRLGELLRTLHELRLPEAVALPVDPFHRTDMTVRVPMTRTAVGALTAVWTAPPLVDELLAAAEVLPPTTVRTLVHGDLHARHVLVDRDGTGTLTGVIDWGDVCRADPSADLSLLWSALPPAGREQFLAGYGPVAHDTLLRARVLALFLCATLASYARDTGQIVLEREMLDGLQRTLTG